MHLDRRLHLKRNADGAEKFVSMFLVPEVNQEVFQHPFPSGSLTAVMPASHGRGVRKRVAFTSRVILPRVRKY